MSNNSTYSTTNYLVPATGTTHLVQTSGVATSAILYGDFRAVQFSGLPFTPQGAYFDNSQGTAPLVVTIQPIGYEITIPTGSTIQSQFPAPSGLTFEITGAGNFNINWVDYPVFPSGSVVDVAGGQMNVAVTNTVPVTVPAVPSTGSAFQTQNVDKPLTCFYSNITTSVSTSINTGGVISYNLQRLQIYISSESTLAVAGELLVQANILNSTGPLIFSKKVYVGTTPGSLDGLYVCDIDFGSGASFNLGINPIVITTNVALNAGSISVNAWVR